MSRSGSRSVFLLADFPVFFRVADKPVLVIGNGEEALNKIRLLHQTKAHIRVVADKPEPVLADFLRDAALEHLSRDLKDTDFLDAKLVFIATEDEATDRALAMRVKAHRIPVNVVDRPHLCDFLTPAIVNRAPVTIAIGSEGAGPVLTQIIRARIEAMLAPQLGALARLAVGFRDQAERLIEKGAARRGFWRGFFEGTVAKAIEQGDEKAAHRAASALLHEAGAQKQTGFVRLVGAGAGAEDLLTLRAQRALMDADIIIYDALVPEAIVAMGRRDAERVLVGKRKGCHSKSQDQINQLLIEQARLGKQVVRLKSGDPLIYGRAGEEMAALRAANIPFEVVPGITSAFAAAADMELPLTLRGVASSLIFTTGHDMHGETLPDWARLAVSGATIAIYMGRSVAGDVASRLMSAGLPADTSVAAIENASRQDKRLFHGTLKDLSGLSLRDDLSGPVMVIIGEAVAGASLQNTEPLSLRQQFAAA
ncbi:siroheme synthase CysG [Paenochrobactrum pullorum]|uniref:siroheme synthase CysG n=1 Tax=Paenochrobactrum pullorum TaxID=1324351 RepID=UPI0035BC1304